MFLANCKKILMGPKPQVLQTAEFFRQPISEPLKLKLVLLGDAIDWSEIERSFSAHFVFTADRTALPARQERLCRAVHHHRIPRVTPRISLSHTGASGGPSIAWIIGYNNDRINMTPRDTTQCSSQS
jgi:hypothetical protein